MLDLFGKILGLFLDAKNRSDALTAYRSLKKLLRKLLAKLYVSLSKIYNYFKSKKSVKKIILLIFFTTIIIFPLLCLTYISGILNFSPALHTAIASFYDKGFIVKKDSLRAMNMYMLSAQDNYAPAQYYLSYHYLNNIKDKECIQEGKQWLEKSVSRNFGPSLILKGKQLIIEGKYKDAIKVLNAIKYTNYKTCGILDVLLFKYINGILLSKKHERSRIRYLLKAYYEGHYFEKFIVLAKQMHVGRKPVDVQRALGYLMENEKLLSEYNLVKYYSIQEAKYWYNSAYKNGEIESALSLAKIYLKEGNNEKAERIYENLTKINCVPAVIELSRMYRKSMPYRPLYKDSCIQLLKSITKISGEACAELGDIYYLSNDHQLRQLAIHYFHKADSLGIQSSKLCNILSHELFYEKKYDKSLLMLKKGLQYQKDDYSNYDDYYDDNFFFKTIGEYFLSKKDTVSFLDTYKLYYQYTKKSVALFTMFNVVKTKKIQIQSYQGNSFFYTMNDGIIESNIADRGFYMEQAFFYARIKNEKYKRYALLAFSKALECKGKYPYYFLNNTFIWLYKFFKSNNDKKKMEELFDYYEHLKIEYKKNEYV